MQDDREYKMSHNLLKNSASSAFFKSDINKDVLNLFCRLSYRIQIQNKEINVCTILDYERGDHTYLFANINNSSQISVNLFKKYAPKLTNFQNSIVRWN